MSSTSSPIDSSAISSTAVQGKVTGIIYPPPDIKAIVNKTAQFVARNGRSFERKIAGETIAPKFSFLKASDPYHAYYEHQVQTYIEEQEAASKAEIIQVQEKQQQEETNKAVEIVKKAEENKDTNVVIEKKPVEALTTQILSKQKKEEEDGIQTEVQEPMKERFALRHILGRMQLSALDYEILQLTAQYTAVAGKSFLVGLATREQRNPQFDFLKPTHPLFASFTALVEMYALVLSKPKDVMDKLTDSMDRMKVLDRCVRTLEWERIQQEKAAQEAANDDATQMAIAQIDWHDFVVVETITFGNDNNDNITQQQAAKGVQGDTGDASSDDMDMDMDDDDDEESKPDIKVVSDYVPQLSAAPSTSTMLTVDGKTVATSDANEHMRILLMDPKWREETQRHMEKKKESSLAAGSAIAASLKRFANKRADIFASSAEEEARLLRATAPQPNNGEDNNLNRLSVNGGEMDAVEGDYNEQEMSNVQIPSENAQSIPPPPPNNIPIPPPMHHMAFNANPPMAPPIMPPGTTLGPPGMSAPGTMTSVASHGAAAPPLPSLPPGATSAVSLGATIGGLPSTLENSVLALEPPIKRQRIADTLLPEDEFAMLHPHDISLTIKIPQDAENSQWNLSGQSIDVSVPVMSTIREIKSILSTQHLGNIPLNKFQLKGPLGFVKDNLTVAHYNFTSGSIIEFSVRSRGGRR